MVVLATTRGMARIGVRGTRTAWESGELVVRS